MSDHYKTMAIRPITEAEVTSDEMADWLAEEFAEGQADFLNKFAYKLKKKCTEKSGSFGWDAQCMWIGNNLNQEAKDVLQSILAEDVGGGDG